MASKLVGESDGRLEAPEGVQGGSVAVCLSEDDNSTIRWDITISVSREAGSRGRYALGRVLTQGPAFSRAVNPAPAPVLPLRRAGRIVAVANCPGATKWFFHAKPRQELPGEDVVTPDRAVAFLELVSSPYPTQTLEPGVYPVNADGIGREVATISTAQLVVGAAAVIVLPVDLDRMRAVIRNNGATSVFLGPSTVTTANGFELPPAPAFDRLEVTHHTAIYAVAVAAGALTLYIENG